MTTSSASAKFVKKLIEVISGISDVSKFTSTRVYGAHISTITDHVLPAISIHLMDTSGPVAGGFHDDLRLQIDLWFNGEGKDAYVWDDVYECFEAMKGTVHRGQLNDSTIGIKVLEMTLVGAGPQMREDGGKILHLPTRWRARVKL